jgi:hypothetical protein
MRMQACESGKEVVWQARVSEGVSERGREREGKGEKEGGEPVRSGSEVLEEEERKESSLLQKHLHKHTLAILKHTLRWQRTPMP